MSTETQYKCDRCSFKDFNQFKFSSFAIEAKGGSSGISGHLCDKCREIIVKTLKEKP